MTINSNPTIEAKTRTHSNNVPFDGLTQPLSIKDYQNIYHQITGRMEEMEQTSTNNLLLTINDIEQIHFKVKQLLDVHQIVGSALAITILLMNDRKEEFTSFERFSKFNSSAHSPTLAVVLRYNFSLLIPDQDKPQNYTITIKLFSRIAIQKKLSDETNELALFIQNGLVSTTAQIKVEYVDYIIARGILVAFDEWLKSCHQTENHFLKFMKRKMRWLYVALPLSIPTLIAVYAYTAAPMLDLPTASFADLARFSIVFFCGFSIIAALTNFLSIKMRDTIDLLYPLSYIQVTKGDENLIRKQKTRHTIQIIKYLINTSIIIALGVVSTKLSLLL